MIVIPTIAELYNQILSDLEAEYSVSIPTVGKNFLRIFAGVQAAKLKLFYLANATLQKNLFADTADSEAKGGTLERFGRVKINRNPFPATAGEYEVIVTGLIGSVIPASSTFKSNDDALNSGKLFVLDDEFTLTATTDYIVVRALEVGTGSSLNNNDKLTATAPIANVNSLVTVNSETETPLEAESIEDYREKILNSFRIETQGGAATDYRIWALDAQGVLRVYPYATSGQTAEVDLYVEAAIADSIDGKGTPSQTILDNLEEVVEFNPDETLELNERGRRPLGVFQVNYLPVSPLDINITINGYIGSTPSIESLITSQIESEILLIRPFVAAADILSDKNDFLDVNKIINMILTAKPGSVFDSVTLNVGGVDVITYTFSGGEIPVLDTVTYA